MTINLATIDFCPGQGGGGGSITPEEQAALDILTDSSEGVLYTNVLSPYQFSLLNTSAPEISQNLDKVYDAGDGDIYYKFGSTLYKYNAAIKDFEKVADFGTLLGSAIWKDNSGRLYDGKNYVLDIENNTRTYIRSTTGYGIQNINGTNRYNIFRGNKGIYDLNNVTWNNDTKSYKFKEDTQTFNTGQYVQGVITNASRLSFYFEYKNHFLFIYNGNVYEITEGDDEVLTTTDVSGNYFNMPDFPLYTPQNIFVKDGVLYYILSEDNSENPSSLYAYDEDGGVWNEITLTQKVNSSYVISGDYLIGGVSYEEAGLYFLSLADQEEKTTSWKPINSVAVDLNSSQRIIGNKSFVSIMSDNLNAEYIAFPNNTRIAPDENTYGIMKIEAATGLILNDKSVATRDFCIYNDVIESPGLEYNVVCQFPAAQGPQGSGVDMNWKMFYTTPSGRVLHINDYRNNVCFEYNDVNESWDVLNTVTNVISSPHRALVDVEGNGVKLWVAKDGILYRWNDTTSDFDNIITTPDGDDIWAGNGTTLRCGTTWTLSYDNVNDTYSWVNATTIPGFTDNIFSYIINGNTYLYVINDPTIYRWDESTGITPVGTLNDTPKGDGDYLAPVGNYLYYYNSNGGINRIDVNATDPDLFDTTADIFVGQSQYGNLPPLIDYKGKCWTGNYVSWSNYNWGWTGAIVPTPIDAPDTDGTYVLKATVVNGQVTYSWVADV